MADEVELERMVVRLMGDGSAYTKMLQDAQKETTTATAAIQKSIGLIERMQVSLGGVGAKFATFGSQFSIVGQGLTNSLTNPLKALGQSSLASFMEAEEGAIKLQAVLKSNGRDVETVTKDYEAFAQGVQNVTRHDDDAVIGMLQVAETMGVTGEQAKRATEGAIGLAAARGIDAKAAMRMTTALEHGNAQMLTRYFPAMKSMKTMAEKVAYAHTQLGNAYQLAQAAADSTTGRIEQMKNHLGNLQEGFGQVIAEAIVPFVDIVKEFVIRFQEASPEMRRTIVAVAAFAAAIGPAMVIVAGLVTLFGAAITALGTIVGPLALVAAGIAALVISVTGLPESWEAAWEATKTFFMGAVGFIMNFRQNLGILMESIKTNWGNLMNWIGKQWANVFQDALSSQTSFVTTMISNGQVLITAFSRLFALIGGAISGTLGKAFVDAVVNALPHMVELFNSFTYQVSGAIQGAFTGVEVKLDMRGDAAKVLRDFKAGGSVKSLEELGKEAGTIITEQAALLKSPLSDWKSSITEGLAIDIPQFNTDTGGLEKFWEGQVKTGGNSTIKAAQHVSEEVAKALNLGDNSAVREGSAEYRALIKESVKAIGGVVPGTDQNLFRAAGGAAAEFSARLEDPEAAQDELEDLEDVASVETTLPFLERIATGIESLLGKDPIEVTEAGLV